MNKKLLFDLTSTQASPEAMFHGGAEYAKLVFHKAVELRYAEQMVCFYNGKWELDSDIKRKCGQYAIELISIDQKKDIDLLIKREDINGFYSAIPYHYHDLNMGDKKFIGTIHGLREIECPGDFYEYKYRKGIISVTKAIIRSLVIPKCVRVRRVRENISKIFAYKNLKIITVSQHSKYSILANFPEIKSEQIIVIDSPYEFQAKKTNDKNSLEKGNSYFLLVSGNRWVKNSYRAIQALDELITEKRLIQHKVIITGCDGYKLLQKVKNRDSFLFLGYVSSKELRHLFQHASYFIYPTLNEGYGYPPLMAFEFGVPVLASGNTSIFEVCKNAAIYFDAHSISEIKTRILRLYSDSHLREKLILNGYEIIEALKEKGDRAEDIVNEIFKK